MFWTGAQHCPHRQWVGMEAIRPALSLSRRSWHLPPLVLLKGMLTQPDFPVTFCFKSHSSFRCELRSPLPQEVSLISWGKAFSPSPGTQKIPGDPCSMLPRGQVKESFQYSRVGFIKRHVSQHKIRWLREANNVARGSGSEIQLPQKKGQCY